jgi:hypothetical protein
MAPRATVRLSKPGDKQKPPVPSRSISHRPPRTDLAGGGENGANNNNNKVKRGPPVPQRSISDKFIRIPIDEIAQLEKESVAGDLAGSGVMRRHTSDSSPPISPREGTESGRHRCLRIRGRSGSLRLLRVRLRSRSISKTSRWRVRRRSTRCSLRQRGCSQALQRILRRRIRRVAVAIMEHPGGGKHNNNNKAVHKALSSPNLANLATSPPKTVYSAPTSGPNSQPGSGITPSLISSAPGTTLLPSSRANIPTATTTSASSSSPSTSSTTSPSTSPNLNPNASSKAVPTKAGLASATTPASTSMVKVKFATPSTTQTAGTAAVPPPIKTLGPTINKSSDEWKGMSRQAKGTTGVVPSIVSTRLNFFQGK